MRSGSENLPEPSLAPSAEGSVDIAILDDDADFRTYLEDFLRDEGLYTVRAFDHPDALFAYCEQRLPDIILLDMKMGEIRGGPGSGAGAGRAGRGSA